MARLIKTTVVYTLFGFLPLASSFFLTPVYTHYLSPADYGIVSLLNVLQSYFSIFILLGFDSAFVRFYHKYSHRKEVIKSLISASFAGILISSTIISALLFLFGDRLMKSFISEASPDFYPLGFYTFLTAAFSALYTVILLYYRESLSLKNYIIICSLYFIFITAGPFIGIVVFEQGVLGSVGGKAAGVLITMLLYLPVFLLRNIRPFYLRMLRNLFIFGLPLIAYSLLAIGFETTDRLFLEKKFSLAEVGIYNIALVLASVTGIFLNSFQGALSPEIISLLKKDTPDDRQRLSIVYRLFMNVSLLLVILCVACSYPFVLYFTESQYHSVVRFVPVLAAGFIGRAYFLVYSNALFYQEKTSTLPLINFLTLIFAVVACYILSPLGITGIAAGILFGRLAQGILCLFFIRRLGLSTAGTEDLSTEHIYTAILILLCFLFSFPAAASFVFQYSIPVAIACLMMILFLANRIFNLYKSYRV